ncbi:MAG: thioredoxin-dependent thiol peroxidase [Bacteroidetes bacterium]|nr:thioredoxin-dependent thiol peroxidase [Bacteroidota bacterium]
MTNLKEGDKAPDFKGEIQDGNEVSLADYKGKKLIIYFYPKDMTSGCTAESCDLRDNYSDLKKKGFEILGVSKDPITSHQKFIDKYDLPFDLLADTDVKMVTDYGVYGEKMNYGRTYMGILRTTFVIDEEGVIERVFTNVNTSDHTTQIMESYQ